MAIRAKDNLFVGGSDSILYNFADAVRQTGYLTYYPAKGNAGSWIVVTDGTFKSETPTTWVAGTNLATDTINTRTYYKKIAETIDLTFEVPINLNGDMFFNIPWALESSSTLLYHLCQIEAFHYDGSTETAIGSKTTSFEYSFESDDATDVGKNQVVGAIKIATGGTIHFKIGDIFRIKLALWTTASGELGGMELGHDPADRITWHGVTGNEIFLTSGSTRMSWYLPIKLDI